ncbi:hypothetical protein ACWCL1_06030 [Ligilactobacillus sp. LYQ135]
MKNSKYVDQQSKIAWGACIFMLVFLEGFMLWGIITQTTETYLIICTLFISVMLIMFVKEFRWTLSHHVVEICFDRRIIIISNPKLWGPETEMIAFDDIKDIDLLEYRASTNPNRLIDSKLRFLRVKTKRPRKSIFNSQLGNHYSLTVNLFYIKKDSQKELQMVINRVKKEARKR